MDQPPTPSAAIAEPLRDNRDFQVVLASQALSALGDAVAWTAMPLLVLALTGSGVAMGVVGALQMLSDLAVALLAGALADRGDRKRLIVLADLGRAGLTALVPLSVAVGGPTLVVIVLITVPLSVFRAIFRAAWVASVPALVGRPQLARANAVLETILNIGFIIGPALAGYLATAIGPGPTLAIDAASFAVSALGLALVARPLRAPADRAPARIVDDVREGIVYIARSARLRSVVALWGIASLVIGPIAIALTVRVTRDLGLPASAFGLVMTGYGIGFVLGSLLAARVGDRSAGVVLVGCLVAQALSFVGFAALTSLPELVAVAVVAGSGEALMAVTYVTARTGWSPDELLGRVASTARVVSLALQPLGILAVGMLLDAFGGGTTIALMGLAVAAVAVAFAPVRALRVPVVHA